MKIPWGVLILRLPKVIYEVNMSCLRIDIKRLYNSITVRIVLGVLFFLAIVDPLYSRFLTLDSMFASYYGINAYQYWLFNFPGGIGFKVYHALFLLLPVLSTEPALITGAQRIFSGISVFNPVSYTHLTLPTT